MALFEVRDLAVSAGGVPLLAGVGLALEPGEAVGVVGPSGSGKTTLLRALALLSDPVRGEVTLRGRGPADWGYPEWRRRVSLVAQRPELLDDTVRQNLARPFGYRTSLGAFPEERAKRALAELGLDDRLDQAAPTLSEGQQQRVSLVRALLVEPDVLLLDEPTSALDARAVRAVEALVTRDVSERGAAALVVTHDAEQAERWCDRVVDLARFAAGEGGRA